MRLSLTSVLKKSFKIKGNNMNKYLNLYSKWLYKGNKKPYGAGYLEVQVKSYPFHTGLQVVLTDGFKAIKVIHCKDAFQAKTIAREFLKAL